MEKPVAYFTYNTGTKSVKEIKRSKMSSELPLTIYTFVNKAVTCIGIGIVTTCHIAAS